MLYTRRGDDGNTGTFGCDQRISKSSNIAEALGSLDEINSFLGLVKLKSNYLNLDLDNKTIKISNIVHQVQEDLFIIQAIIAGSNKKITKQKILYLENIINNIENIIPPISSFFISGGGELSTLFDIARTISRRTERKVIILYDQKSVSIEKEVLAYLNRLSSLLYALARYSNHMDKIKEYQPTYS